MSDPRAEVLARIRAALGAVPAVPTDVPRDYRLAGAPGSPDLVELFRARVEDYRATVHEVEPDALGDMVAARCADRGVRRVVVSPDPPAALTGIEVVCDDPPLTAAQLDAVDGVITGCALAIAETGTIVLDSGPLSGRRAITLVPDYHLCVVDTASIVATVPDAIAQLAAPAAEGRPITFVSGPSATSDIELDRVEGVHGPRTLDVVLVQRARDR